MELILYSHTHSEPNLSADVEVGVVCDHVISYRDDEYILACAHASKHVEAIHMISEKSDTPSGVV
jgi:hypothetical protein